MNDSAPILEFDNVVLSSLEGMPDRGLSFSLSPGSLFWLEVDPEHVECLADAITGLVEPDAGTIRYGGHTWSVRTADEQSAQRASIRRVFSHKGWISNLDIDENLILARYHHEGGDEESLLDDCRAVAGELGLAMVRGRPEKVHSRQLHPLQWIRALTGSSRLLVVGYRRELLVPEMEEALVQALHRRMTAGLAVIWIGRNLPERLWGVPSPDVCAKLRLSSETS